MLTVTSLIGGGAGSAEGPFAPTGVIFDGTNDYITATPLGSSSDSTVMSASFWVNMESTVGPSVIYCNDFGHVMGQCQIETSGAIKVMSFLNGSQTTYRQTTGTPIGTGDGWQHVGYKYTTDPYGLTVYVDGSAEAAVSIYSVGSAFTMDNTTNFDRVGDDRAAGSKNHFELAELWVDFGQSVDFSDTATREKFRDSDGQPVDLGADGTTPTGTAPDVYLSVREGEAAAAFITNRGLGNNFVQTGALALSATNPGD